MRDDEINNCLRQAYQPAFDMICKASLRASSLREESGVSSERHSALVPMIYRPVSSYSTAAQCTDWTEIEHVVAIDFSPAPHAAAGITALLWRCVPARRNNLSQGSLRSPLQNLLMPDNKGCISTAGSISRIGRRNSWASFSVVPITA